MKNYHILLSAVLVLFLNGFCHANNAYDNSKVEEYLAQKVISLEVNHDMLLNDNDIRQLKTQVIIQIIGYRLAQNSELSVYEEVDQAAIEYDLNAADKRAVLTSSLASGSGGGHIPPCCTD